MVLHDALGRFFFLKTLIALLHLSIAMINSAQPRWWAADTGRRDAFDATPLRIAWESKCTEIVAFLEVRTSAALMHAVQ